MQRAEPSCPGCRLLLVFGRSGRSRYEEMMPREEQTEYSEAKYSRISTELGHAQSLRLEKQG